jgi:hypothetical protein
MSAQRHSRFAVPTKMLVPRDARERSSAPCVPRAASLNCATLFVLAIGALAMTIAPGTSVCVEIKTTPRKDAAVKTLRRICAKDPEIDRQVQSVQRKRPSDRPKRRGGRVWHHLMKTISPVTLTAGAKYRVLATVDVLRDLASVARWVSVTPA